MDRKNRPTKSLKFPKKQKDLKECTYVVLCSLDNMSNSFSH